MEESKPPKKSAAKLSPAAVALIGLLSGVVSIGTAMLAHHIGFPLSELAREGLVLGGVASMLGGAAGARFMPTSKDPQ